MRHAGLNMGITQSYVRFALSFLLFSSGIYFQLWYLLVFGGILFYTAYTKFCLMFSILGINKKLSIENYFHALIPKYSPHASCIFNELGELIYINNAAKETFLNLDDATYFGISDINDRINNDTIADMLFENRGQTFQLHIHGMQKEGVLLLQAHNITNVLKLEYINSNLQTEVEHALSDNELKNHLLAQQSKLATTGQLIENITHQWKQPLSTLSVLFQNMKINNEMGTLTAKEAEETVTQGLKLTQIMEKTVDDFRNFFKVDKERSDFTVQSCLEDVMLILGAALQKAGILVNNNIYETVKVQGLKNEFTQVLLNIINNAKDALIETNPATKKIDIDTSIVDDRVRICITDTAGGIPKEHMDKIFESHFTTKEDKEGTGIGLHMSKTIIETDMHGSIKAENTTQGARFIIELPILTN